MLSKDQFGLDFGQVKQYSRRTILLYILRHTLCNILAINDKLAGVTGSSALSIDKLRTMSVFTASLTCRSAFKCGLQRPVASACRSASSRQLGTISTAAQLRPSLLTGLLPRAQGAHSQRFSTQIHAMVSESYDIYCKGDPKVIALRAAAMIVRRPCAVVHVEAGPGRSWFSWKPLCWPTAALSANC